MNEFNIEEKANAYDIAIKKAKQLLSKCKHISDKASMIYRAEDIENIFPELQKPNDEKIKETLIELVKCNERCGYTLLNNVSTSSMIDWIEKQEQSKKISIWKHWKNGIAGNGEGKLTFLIKNGVTYSLSSCLSFECDYIELSELENLMLEKQDNLIDIANKEYWRGYREGKQEALDKYAEFEKQDQQNEQKEINLAEILKHYPRETELYSPLYGKLWLAEVDEKCGIITCYKHPLEKDCTRAILKQEDTVSFYSNGTTGLPDCNVSDDCMLFLYDCKKQNEQKSVNKIESKFHEGDFIKHNKSNIIYKVLSVDNDSYFLINIEKGEMAGKFERFNLEQNFHFWTIRDAENGDILWHSDSASNGIFIFKEIRNDGKVLCYCDYDSEDHFCLGEHHTCCWTSSKYVKPATREQRGLLFKKIQESGYIWDANKKELINIL